MPSESELTILVKAKNEASRALKQVSDEVRSLDDKAIGGLRKASDALGRGFDSLVDKTFTLGKRLLQIGAIAAVAGAAIGIKMNSELETATLQFETLLGSAEEAQKHVKSLFDFAKLTPFETGPIIEASRMMRTFGGAALDTQENLKMVGDAAAATSQQINEVAFWTGRMYAAVQGGKPFGEAAMRLQEMAILSNKARDEMEKLQDSGASADKVWAVFTEDMRRFNDAMVKQATTWKGLTSTLKDVISLDLAFIFEPLFDAAKNATSAIIEFSTTEAWQKMRQNARSSVGAVANEINKLVDAFKEGGLQGALDSVKQSFDKIDFGGAFNKAMEKIDFPGLVNSLMTGFISVVDRIDWGQHAMTFTNAFIEMLMGIDWVAFTVAAVKVLVKAIPGILQGFFEGLIQAAITQPMDFLMLLIALFPPFRIGGILKSVFGKIPFIGTFFNVIIDALGAVSNLLFGPIWNVFTRLGMGVINAIKGQLAKLRLVITGYIDDALQGVWGFFGRFVDAGWGLIRGFASGIRGAAGEAVNAVKGVLKRLRDMLPFSDAKVGPLSELTKSGRMFSETFARGIVQGQAAIRDAASRSLQVGSPTPILPGLGETSAAPAAIAGPSIIQNNTILNQVDLDRVTRDLAWRLQQR